MWNQTRLLQQRAAQLPDRSGIRRRAAIRDVIGRNEPVFVHVHRPDVVSQAVAVRPGLAGAIWTLSVPAGCQYAESTSSHHQELRYSWKMAGWLAEETKPIYRLPGVMAQPDRDCASVLDAIGQIPNWRSKAGNGRPTSAYEWVDRYRWRRRGWGYST